ncbi:transketolase [Clostridium folliculivorans]|uniref:Transketolase n=1 Tax=Clostridium folliculivorans TaxID=2886038 RepID=A0A9W5Y1P1_9CLOT|nr:transketolase [Clostridium folliculivorans]GKU24862.1 transketolase [Clostridium folliculivorans]GKU30960.1 transketolase [Clostridium folliculivorans]
MSKNIDNLTVDSIRLLSAEAVQKANSGHPGLPMGAAPMAYAIFDKVMKHSPKNPKWFDRDRFVLSAGHGSMLLYSLLHLYGYGLTVDDLKNFRQKDSKTPGHPEYGHTVGVEITTGPLGQGQVNSVGMAMAESFLAKKFNRPGYEIVNHYTYALSGDGDMMEGITGEGASLAATLGLGKLIVLYDSNKISIEGDTDIAFREDVGARYAAYGWQVLTVEDGNDVAAITKALEEAKKETEKPSLVIVKTVIGYGSPKAGTSSVHGEPLGVENIKKAKEFLGWSYEEEFHVPEEVREHLCETIERGTKVEEEWNKLFESYKKEYPEIASEWELWNSGEVKADLLSNEEYWNFEGKLATRVSSEKVINRLMDLVPNLIGGSADLAPSTKTYMKGKGDFSKEDRSGRNLHFGVREHAMAAIANGIAVHGGLVPYVSTFFVFSDYMKASMRLSALMKIPVVYVLTHDSIGVGEDGPTHEPIEQLAMLRSIPNMHVFRPADSKETAAAWLHALKRKDGPTSIVLSRQNLPLYNETSPEALKGAYILKDSEKEVPDMLLMATGSEVELIYEAQSKLKEEGIDARVISIPSLEVFEAQGEEYKEKLMPKAVRKRVAVEAASSFGWHKYVGLDGKVVSIDTFGASAPGDILFKEFGFTVDNVIKTAKEL